MKIELIKETKPFDKVIYFTEVDGSFLENSLELDESKARANYEFAKAHGGKMFVKEVIKSEEV